MDKPNKNEEVYTKLELSQDLIIEPRVTKRGLFGTVRKKRTFKEVISPLATLRQDLQDFINSMSEDVINNKYEIEQIRLEIASDTAEIEEAEGSLQFINQVINATKSN